MRRADPRDEVVRVLTVNGDLSTRDASELVQQLLDTATPEMLMSSGLLSDPASVRSVAAQLRPIWEADEVHVVDTRVNGPRIDVRLRAGQARAWLIVLWATSQPLRIDSVTVYARPEPCAPGRSGLVVVLNGPSSVGKSTLMRAFTETETTPWAYLDEPFFGQLPGRYLAWPGAAGPTSEGCLAALAASAREGNRLIVSTAGISQARFCEALTAIPTLYVGLDAPLEVLIQRQRNQADKFGGLAQASVDIHDGWTYELRIDTARTPPDSAAKTLSALVAAHDADHT